MKIRGFLNVVPKSVQYWALIVAGCALLTGLVFGYRTGDFLTMSAYASAAMMFGVLLATWLVCLGFVFADARRRNMGAALWVLVAALFPHLLGFLLYFVMRHPIAATCSHCGMSVSTHQRFCSWCGTPLVHTSSSAEPVPLNPLQGASQ